MNDHNLDDLIIDNIKPKNSKAKSLLTIISLLIVVLIVAIILTKVILKDPNETNISQEDNNTEMISPELRLQNVAQKKEKVKEETKLSTIIEKELSEPVKAPEVKEIVETAEPAQAEELKAEVPEKEEPKVEEEKKEETAPKSVEITKEFTQTQVKPEVKESPKAKEVVVPETKPTPTQEKKTKTTTSASGHAFYIQVGSFSKTPSSRFLARIKSSGFNYKITTTGKTKKLLVGPYRDRTSANSALVKVKDRINKSAFVVKK